VTTSRSETQSFGALLRQHRLAASLSQEQLGERAQLSVTAIAALERGRRTALRPATVVLLADALKLAPAERAVLISTAAPARHNLPMQLSSFVGRVQQIADIRRELAMTRLLTLTGPGGVGKTRLAPRVAEEELGTHRDGI
jgi:transcriptional regulator with XRE-family HTH domain